jgi:hypothetical protein
MMPKLKTAIHSLQLRTSLGRPPVLKLKMLIAAPPAIVRTVGQYQTRMEEKNASGNIRAICLQQMSEALEEGTEQLEHPRILPGHLSYIDVFSSSPHIGSAWTKYNPYFTPYGLHLTNLISIKE